MDNDDLIYKIESVLAHLKEEGGSVPPMFSVVVNNAYHSISSNIVFKDKIKECNRNGLTKNESYQEAQRAKVEYMENNGFKRVRVSDRDASAVGKSPDGNVLLPGTCKYQNIQDEPYAEGRPCRGLKVICKNPEAPPGHIWYSAGCNPQGCSKYSPDEKD